jgi:phosphoserine phosphatase
MKVLPCKQPTYFDVDDTLVMWSRPAADDPDAIEIACPTSRTERFLLEMTDDGTLEPDTPTETVSVGSWTERLKPHKKHIEQLKLHKLRGHTIIVWSAGGWEWAEAVVRALKLEQYVDLVIEKPMWFYDDLMPNEFMGKRYYMKDE